MDDILLPVTKIILTGVFVFIVVALVAWVSTTFMD